MKDELMQLEALTGIVQWFGSLSYAPNIPLAELLPFQPGICEVELNPPFSLEQAAQLTYRLLRKKIIFLVIDH